MNHFLADLTVSVPPNIHAVLVLDAAGWNDPRLARVPPNLTLVPLPPYSPELNSVERVWALLARTHLSHRPLADYEAVVEACCRTWNALTGEIGCIMLLFAYQYLKISVNNLW